MAAGLNTEGRRLLLVVIVGEVGSTTRSVRLEAELCLIKRGADRLKLL